MAAGLEQVAEASASGDAARDACPASAPACVHVSCKLAPEGGACTAGVIRTTSALPPAGQEQQRSCPVPRAPAAGSACMLACLVLADEVASDGCSGGSVVCASPAGASGERPPPLAAALQPDTLPPCMLGSGVPLEAATGAPSGGRGERAALVRPSREAGSAPPRATEDCVTMGLIDVPEPDVHAVLPLPIDVLPPEQAHAPPSLAGAHTNSKTAHWEPGASTPAPAARHAERVSGLTGARACAPTPTLEQLACLSRQAPPAPSATRPAGPAASPRSPEPVVAARPPSHPRVHPAAAAAPARHVHAASPAVRASAAPSTELAVTAARPRAALPRCLGLACLQPCAQRGASCLAWWVAGWTARAK